MNFLAAALALILYLFLLVLKFHLARRYAQTCPAAATFDFSTVTILQPVVSGDPRLEEVLLLTLGTFRSSPLVWIVDDDDLPARVLCLRLQQENPGQPSQLLLTPPPPQGENPKAFKLALAEATIRTPFLVVLDDDTRLSIQGMNALLGGLERAELSTGLPCYLPGLNVPSNLVAQFVNNQSVLTYLPLLVFFPPITCNGMCYAMRTAQLAALGGFARIRRRAADDLAIAQLVINAGKIIKQTVTPHFIATSVVDWRHYFRLMHRWFVFATLLVRDQPPKRRLLILLFHGSPPFLLWLGLALALSRPTIAALGLIALTLFVRAALMMQLQRTFFGRPMHRPALSLLSELFQPMHFIHALISRTVLWRKRWIQVRTNRDFRYV